jgi:hypothetical protein
LIISFRKADKTSGGTLGKCFKESSKGPNIPHLTKLRERWRQAEKIIKKYGGKELTRKDRKYLERFIHKAREFVKKYEGLKGLK